MQYIKLTRGKIATVCDCHYELVAKHNWIYIPDKRGAGYAATAVWKSPYKQRTIRMHRLILDASADTQVDHRDGNGLNNQCSNLRLASAAQNAMNRVTTYKNGVNCNGVAWYPEVGKWRARIRKDKKLVSLGYYNQLENAILARRIGEAIYFGEWARRS